MLNKIEKKIIIKKRADITKKQFINNEMFPYIKSSFYCCNCQKKNHINIIPYETGHPFSELYMNNYLSENEILDNRIAKVTSIHYRRFGHFTINNLPTFYFAIKCIDCDSIYLIVFSFGEKQPSLEICQMSDAYEIEYI